MIKIQHRMKTQALTRRTYEAPASSVDVIAVEQCFLASTATPGQLKDMDPEDLYDEDF